MDEFWLGLLRHVETAVMLPLCLLAVLVVHELGHYLAARLSGMKVDSVIFGRGRLLWSQTDQIGTVWRLHLWPFRAHVQIAGFNGNETLSLRRKLFVVLAGPAANLLLPVLLFFVFFALIGKPAIPNIVTAIEPAMPAYKAGLRPGDKILSIDGHVVESMEDITAYTFPRRHTPLNITYNRQGEIFTVPVLPVWTQYRDIEGVRRAHGRIGLSTYQQAYNLKVIRSVAGLPTPDVDAARAALLQHMGERTEIGMWSDDDRVYTSVIDLSKKANKHLGDARHKEYKKFYMGTMRDNLYLPLSPEKSMIEALEHTGVMISHVALLPFNLFPIDKEWITPEAVVSAETSFIGTRLYIFVFFTSLCSCFIGLLNLIPFPRLDGSAILWMLGERFKHRPLSNKEKAAMLVFGVLFFYAAVFGANAIDMRGYYMFQMQKAAAAEH